MPTHIKNGYVLDTKEKIIKLENELSADSDFSAKINKKDGVYFLTVSSISNNVEFDINLGDKIPPDTGTAVQSAEMTENNHTPKVLTINIH